MNEKKYAESSEMLYKGRLTKGMDFNSPASFPYFPAVSFTMNTLSDVKAAYASRYTYIRTNNPNRDALAEVVTYLEQGEDSLILASGMAAISTTLFTLLKPGDHIVCNSNLYGETFDVMGLLMNKFGVETDLVNFDDMDKVRGALKPNTKLIYTEVCANPTLNVVDVAALAELAHSRGALLMIDNTFTSPIAIKPIELGADIVINSMTKFMNGHSDAILGSVTASQELIDAIQPISMLCGTPGDPYAAFSMLKSFQTMDLRVKKQMANAAKLAEALEKHPAVSKVYHPSLSSFPQHELAMKQFASKEAMSGMMSFVVPEQEDKFDDFLSSLHFVRYAMTLGGLHTTLAHPVTSSHAGMPDDQRRAMGITPGLFRLSVGIEEAEDLIADFTQALEVFSR